VTVRDLDQADRELGDLLRRSGVLPVLTLDDPDVIVPLAEALEAADIGAIEITLRTGVALRCIRELSRTSSLRVGAGTECCLRSCRVCDGAGATFLVSPSFDASVDAMAREREVAYTPGVATPTELQNALSHNRLLVKLFPAAALGGLAMIRALSEPFPQARFVPTGGLSQADISELAAHPAVVAVGGSWVAPIAAVEARAWDQITELGRSAVAAAAVARP
jgi:2-dehydro-3-deoxyphosphogluconate aldolase/(4S)-4-hydroxy-2-oxoglutarate aldolase